MSTPSSTSAMAMWDDHGASVNMAVWIEDTVTPVENCIFVKMTGNYKPDSTPGAYPEVVPCLENDPAAGIIVRVFDQNPKYAPATAGYRVATLVRGIRARMYNDSGVAIGPGLEISTYINGRIKVYDGLNGRVEGRTLEDIPNNSYGWVYIKD